MELLWERSTLYTPTNGVAMIAMIIWDEKNIDFFVLWSIVMKYVDESLVYINS